MKQMNERVEIERMLEKKRIEREKYNYYSKLVDEAWNKVLQLDMDIQSLGDRIIEKESAQVTTPADSIS